MLQMLARTVSQGGASGLQKVLAQKDNGIGAEVAVDKLGGLLFVASVGTEQILTLEELTDDNASVSIARVDPVLETFVVDGLVAACQLFSENRVDAALAKIEATPRLTGFRAATANYLVEAAASKTDSLSANIEAVAKLRNLVWQEQGLDVIARVAVRRGQFEAAKAAIDETPVKPGSVVSFLHGLVCGAVEMLAAQG